MPVSGKTGCKNSNGSQRGSGAGRLRCRRAATSHTRGCPPWPTPQPPASARRVRGPGERAAGAGPSRRGLAQQSISAAGRGQGSERGEVPTPWLARVARSKVQLRVPKLSQLPRHVCRQRVTGPPVMELRDESFETPLYCRQTIRSLSAGKLCDTRCLPIGPPGSRLVRQTGVPWPLFRQQQQQRSATQPAALLARLPPLS
jgi:hypothetical protein